MLYYSITYSSSCYSTNIFFFFFNDTATTEIYTLSLHDALPIFASFRRRKSSTSTSTLILSCRGTRQGRRKRSRRSEEHTSELQSQSNLVCRLLLEKKKTNYRSK